MTLVCKQNLNALVSFLLNEVNVIFHLTGTIVLKQVNYCYTNSLDHLAMKKKALEITLLEGFQDGRSWCIYYARIPKSN